jgi:signal transduction histidine kinase
LKIFSNGMGRDLRLWPMLCLLLIVVFAPTACLLWFMDRAIENERLAMLKTLEDAYRRDLREAQSRLERFWRDRVESLNQCAAAENATAIFAKCIRSGLSDGVICFDDQGRVSYPAAPVSPSDRDATASIEWEEAGRLENEENDFPAAAEAYAAIARGTVNVNLSARAIQARARCLVQAGDRDGAVKLIVGTLSDEKYARAVDPQGRLIVPNMQLMALQLLGNGVHLSLEKGEDKDGPHPASPQGRGDGPYANSPDGIKELREKLADQLLKRLEDYDDPALSAPQRLFLMQKLSSFFELIPFPIEKMAGDNGDQAPLTLTLSQRERGQQTLRERGQQTLRERGQQTLRERGQQTLRERGQQTLRERGQKTLRERGLETMLFAEELAARCVGQGVSIPRQHDALQPGPMPGVWQFASANGRVLALWRTETIVAQGALEIGRVPLPGETAIVIRPPNSESPAGDVFNSLPAGGYLPDWQLTLSMIGGNASDAAANRRIAMYLWTAVLVIAAIALLAGLLLQILRNQMRYARLKNDLVATVSHELKTPLSSIRLLVDTLLDEHSPDSNKTRDYLQLIAKENARLSRLIDNFLAFSRIERNKHAFQFAVITPTAVINEALESVGERFQEPGCRLDIDVAADLPSIKADADALVAAVLNLLDNAYKYTGEEKRVSLRAYVENDNVCIAVSDNGVGLTRAAAKRIFERFYQADRRLSRNSGGCGLGLSIVQYVVAAHGGSVDVASRPNAGSTFTVKLPKPTGCNPRT